MTENPKHEQQLTPAEELRRHIDKVGWKAFCRFYPVDRKTLDAWLSGVQPIAEWALLETRAGIIPPPPQRGRRRNPIVMDIDEFNQIVRDLGGLSDAAHAVGVSVTTLWGYQRQYRNVSRDVARKLRELDAALPVVID